MTDMPEKTEKTEKTEKEENKKEKSEESGSMATIAVVIILVLLSGYVYMGITGNAIFAGNKADVIEEKIKIGFMGPLTGDAASYGHGIKRGVELALKDSGLQNVEVVFEDTKCDGREAVNAINKLININGVIAIIGEVCSGATLAAAPVAEKNGVVLISASSTSSKITDSGDYIFRTIPSDINQGRFAANFMFKNNISNLSILYGNEEYGVGFNDILTTEFEDLGGKVVASESFERGSTDIRTQLTKIRKTKPQALFIVSNSPDSAIAAIKQVKQMGMKVKLYGSEGLKGPEIAATKYAQGLIVTSVSAGSKKFSNEYMVEYGLETEPFSPQGYDAFMAIVKAMELGADTGEAIKDNLYDVEFEGASGDIDFDENGDVSGIYNIYRLTNGTFVLIP